MLESFIFKSIVVLIWAVNATNVSGFIGWTLWSGGSFDQSYVLNLAPYDNGTERPQMSQAVDHHLNPATK